jgi:hypothetical protein
MADFCQRQKPVIELNIGMTSRKDFNFKPPTNNLSLDYD